MKLKNTTIYSLTIFSIVTFSVFGQKGKKHTFTIEQQTDIKIDKKKKLATVSPETYVRKASYNHFLIPLTEFNKKVGKKTNVTVTCQETSRRKRTVKSNPNSQSPEGGIQNVEILCRNLSVKAVPVETEPVAEEAGDVSNDYEQRKK